MKTLILSLFMAGTVLLTPLPVHAAKWVGIDEAVVEKVAKEHGREAREPLIDVDGDIGLFVFLIAGAAGGFAGGYYWRKLMEPKQVTSQGHSEIR